MDFAVPFSVRNIFSRTLAVRIASMTLLVILATLPLLAQKIGRVRSEGVDPARI